VFVHGKPMIANRRVSIQPCLWRSEERSMPINH
jgi:hypothetical protein